MHAQEKKKKKKKKKKKEIDLDHLWNALSDDDATPSNYFKDSDSLGIGNKSCSSMDMRDDSGE